MHSILGYVKSTIIIYSLLTVSYVCVGWIHAYYCVPHNSLDIVKSILVMGSPACNTAIDIMKVIHDISTKWWATISIIVIAGLNSQQKLHPASTTTRPEE